MKKTALALALLACLCLVAFFGYGPVYVEQGMNRVLPHAEYEISDSARRLHAGLLVGDLHADSTLWNRDLEKWSGRGHVDLPRLRAGNVALQVFPSVTKTPAGLNYDRNSSAARDNITLLAFMQRWPISSWSSLTERALYQAHKLHTLAARAPEQLRLVQNRADLEQLLAARAAGATPVGGLLAIEGAHALDARLDNIDRLYTAGFRMIGLQHFFDNAIGGSLHGDSGDGLTPFGRDVVRRLQQLGVIVDLAHSSPQVVREVLAMSQAPVVVSHTGFQGNCATPRNIEDALMQQVAAADGLIGIGYWDAAVCDVTPEGITRAIRYAIDLVGEDHIALGSDYDGATTVPFDTSELAVLTDRMLREDFTETEIRKVMGGNMARFLAENLPAAETSAGRAL